MGPVGPRRFTPRSQLHPVAPVARPRKGHTMLDELRTAAERRTEDGATAVEYGFLVAGIAVLVVAIVMALGGQIAATFQTTCSTISAGSHSTGQTC